MCSRTRATAVAAACVAALLLLVLAPAPAAATLVSAVEAVTRGIGAKLQEFKGGEGLVVSPADIEGLLNTPCGELGGEERGRRRSSACPGARERENVAAARFRQWRRRFFLG